ncbi:MAG: divergent polysaccharide deacetylase family protein [Actinobacteria bacterium]|nr:divergent polysaccharide deacetylase family protein [Actinomycetota bacterium]
MRRRRRRLIPLVVIAVLALAIILFSPWGLLKGSLYSCDNAESTKEEESKSNRSEEGSESGKTEEDTKEEQAQSGPVEKKSDTRPPSVAIVVDDVGFDATNLPQWLAIDAPLSFAVVPYCVLSAGLSDQLYDAGYLIMMHIPTENMPPQHLFRQGAVILRNGQQYRLPDAGCRPGHGSQRIGHQQPSGRTGLRGLATDDIRVRVGQVQRFLRG